MEAQQSIRSQFEELQTELSYYFKFTDVASSESWIMWDILKQQSLQAKPQTEYEAPLQGLGKEVHLTGSALEGAPELNYNGEEQPSVRDSIVYRHVGWELHQAVAGGQNVSGLGLPAKFMDLAQRPKLHSYEYVELGIAAEAALSGVGERV